MRTHWRLPRGVDEILPPAAWEFELLRRKVLDVFFSWGFDYVEPPVIEYLESLQAGGGEDLDLQTLKVVDQVTGKQLGIRADMTSQAARIDAHSLITDGVQRLCYAGPVVFANPQIAMTSRVPFKAGAEIFGAANVEADAEIVGLMLESLAVAEIAEPVLLLGHMGIYQGLVEAMLEDSVLHPKDERALFQCVQRKSQSDISALLKPSALRDLMVRLPTLMGDVQVLHDATRSLQGAPTKVLQAVGELQRLADLVVPRQATSVRVDVSELSGYGYHNGPVFAVYHPRHGQALAQGGRYDGIGEVFGRARSATGFDVDLKTLIQGNSVHPVIFAPFVDESQRADLAVAIATLRHAGHRVRGALSEHETRPPQCSQSLEWIEGQWRVTDHAQNV